MLVHLKIIKQTLPVTPAQSAGQQGQGTPGADQNATTGQQTGTAAQGADTKPGENGAGTAVTPAPTTGNNNQQDRRSNRRHSS